MATYTFYPAAGTANVTVDGTVQRTGAPGATWSQTHDGAGTLANPTGAALNFGYIDGRGADYELIVRSIFTFDTSTLPDTETISSAKLSLCSGGIIDTLNQSMIICSSNPAANDNLVASDYNYNNFGTATAFSTVDVTSLSNVDGTYNDFDLNASGIANINKTGISKFGGMLSGDFTNTAPGNDEVQFWGYMADNGTNKPKLTVVVGTISAFIPKIMIY